MIWIEFTNEGDDGITFPILSAAASATGCLCLELYPLSLMNPEDDTIHIVPVKDGKYLVNGKQWNYVGLGGSPDLRLQRLTTDSSWAIGLERNVR
jgi:hypothetical protein